MSQENPISGVRGLDPLPLAAPNVRVTCWGTRGSVPSPGLATARYGGNTSCIEVAVSPTRSLILDAGTGIRALGEQLLSRGGPVVADLFLTHFHWDHIQGVPFFAPLYDRETFLRVHAPNQGELDIQSLFAGQMGPVYFPIPFDALSATIEFSTVGNTPWLEDGVEVHAIRVRHPAHTYGYRVRVGGAAVAYIPDNELVGGRHAVSVDERGALVDFLAGVDVLLHDAMYTDREYRKREGWGHSTFTQAVELAEEAGVRRLMFFHHAPERTDAELVQILDELRTDLERRGSTLELDIAAEGTELLVEERST